MPVFPPFFTLTLADRMLDVTMHCRKPEEVSMLSVTPNISGGLSRVQQDLPYSFNQYF